MNSLSLSLSLSFKIFVFIFVRILDIESGAWLGLEETAGSSPAKDHVGAVCCFLSILSLPACVHVYIFAIVFRSFAPEM